MLRTLPRRRHTVAVEPSRPSLGWAVLAALYLAAAILNAELAAATSLWWTRLPALGALLMALWCALRVSASARREVPRGAVRGHDGQVGRSVAAQGVDRAHDVRRDPQADARSLP